MEVEFGKNLVKRYEAVGKSEIIPTEVSVRIEKTELAKKLEEVDDIGGLDFGIYQHSPYDAGYDVRACIPNTIQLNPGNRIVIPTGLRIELSNPNYETQMRPRSGLSAKHGITILNSPGTIDFGYRDEIKVILYNTSFVPFIIEQGDRIAQLCFRRVPTIDIEYVNEISREDDRGGGLGSSGVK